MSEGIRKTHTRIEAYTESKVNTSLDLTDYDPDQLREGYEYYAWGEKINITPNGVDVTWWLTDAGQERLKQPDVQFHLVWVPELVALVPRKAEPEPETEEDGVGE